MTVRRSVSVPLYMQLKAVITSQIERGDLRPHAKLPSERDLCRHHGMSRMTVRHALNSLVREGIIYTEPGRGVFVCDASLSLDIRVSLAGFTEDITRSGAVPETHVVERALVPANGRQQAALHCQAGDELVKVERLRLVNGAPLALHTSYLPHRLCPDILRFDLAGNSLMRILSKEYGLAPRRAEQTVRATLANPRERQLLNLPDPSAVLGVERITYLDSGEVIEFAQGVYCGEWYRLHFGLDPETSRLHATEAQKG